MTAPFSPTGRVALIEPQMRGRAGFARPCPLIGVVDTEREHDWLSIIGVSSPNLADGTEVVVSIFGPDALYRIRAVARWNDSGELAVGPTDHVERIQRRNWPRHPLELDVILARLDGPDAWATGVPGRTLDLGMGGVRVLVSDPLPAAARLNVILTLPGGAPFVTQTTIVSIEINAGGCEYRLAFGPLDELDAIRLTALVGAQTSLTTTA